ncbi:hypothetical protein RN001_015358 [Aquatica leii]|uniref:Nuclear condensin complex subunit 3 C-terminal domain-containing protein n=1 Tax=Aquatica leii TaxID=1421715 RepID=A0AAN7SD75_9COLE|nr:hypothetical protein RN001_015358 [Aquatica leii]
MPVRKVQKAIMNLDLYNKICQVLENVQRNTASNQRCQVILTNLYKNSDPEQFYACFKRILCILLNKSPKLKNVYVEKVIDFCMLFCANVDNGLWLFENTVDFLLEYHNVESDGVRFRVCEFLNKLLGKLAEEEVSEEICSSIEDAMLFRLEVDNKAEIRYQAVCGVYRLQDVYNVDCKVMPKLILHMNNDLSWKVRMACTEKIHLKRDSIVALVSRTRDVNSSVRLTAFKRLSHCVKSLKISERHLVILNGFFDTCKGNVQYVSNNLVTAWLEQYDNNYITFVHSLRSIFEEKDVEESTKITGLVLKALFKHRPYEEAIEALPIGNDHVIPMSKLNWETVIFWRFLIDTLRKSQDLEMLLDRVVPELVDFAMYIQRFITEGMANLDFQFVVNELFTITEGFDVSDTVSRNVLTKLVLTTLRNVELCPTVVTTLVNNLKKTIPTLEDRIQVLSKLISDLIYPPQENNAGNINKNFRISELNVRLHELDDKLRKVVEEEDYETAIIYKDEITQVKIELDDLEKEVSVPTQLVKTTEASSIIKSLNVARAMLLFPEVTCLNPVLRTLNECVIMEFLTDGNLAIRDKAMECFGLCCIVDRKCAQKGITLFITCILANEMMETSNVESVVVSIKAVSDMFILYGQDLLENLDEELPTISPSQVVQLLVNLMDDDSLELRECAATALCNLIVYGRVQSATLISRMILKWCNPALDDESERVRQRIGLMLEKLPSLSGSANLLENAFLPTIKTILNAPKTSPLSDVNLQSLEKFMLSLCSVCHENDRLHDLLAFKICMEINDDHDEFLNVTLSKILLLLDIKPDATFINDLIKICNNIIKDDQINVTLRNVNKFVMKLKSLKEKDNTLQVIPE